MNLDRTLALLGLPLLLALTLLVFYGCLFSPFHFDDSLFLDSPQVTQPGNPWYLLRPTQPRPLTYLTFYLNYRLGGASPFGYHLVNLLLHLANTAAFYYFARLLIRRRPSGVDPLVGEWLPLISAAVFALHPIQSEAVNYAYQRSTLLAAFFGLGCLNSFLKSETSQQKPFWLLTSCACYVLAIASKETACILPLLWLALLWAEGGDFRNFRKLLFGSYRLGACLLIAAAGAAWMLLTLRGRSEGSVRLVSIHSSFQYLLSQIQVLSTYLRMLIWPAGLSIDHDFQPAPIASLYALGCYLLLASILLIAVRIRRYNPIYAFLIAAFLILLAPTSSLIPSPDLLFEHRLYLPMVAWSILTAWTVFYAGSLFERAEKRGAFFSLLSLCILLVGWAGLSRRQTDLWRNNIRLWEDAATKAPRKPRTHYNLASAYLVQDRTLARKEFRKTVELDPNHSAALYNLGWLDQTDGALDSARKYYQAAIDADPKCWQAHHNLGNLDIVAGDVPAAAYEFQKTIDIRPDYWPAYQSQAAAELQSGDAKSALRTLLRLEKLKPDLLEARYLRACALIADGSLAEAESELRFISDRDASGIYRDRIRALQENLLLLTRPPQ